jgi:hypothetical protein
MPATMTRRIEQRQDQEPGMQGDWSITITGDIVSINQEDVDKSGRHPKFFYEFLVWAESTDGWSGASRAPAEFRIRIKDVEFKRLTKEMLAVGDRVIMTARANGPNPSLFYLTEVKKLAAQ